MSGRGLGWIPPAATQLWYDTLISGLRTRRAQSALPDCWGRADERFELTSGRTAVCTRDRYRVGSVRLDCGSDMSDSEWTEYCQELRRRTACESSA